MLGAATGVGYGFPVLPRDLTALPASDFGAAPGLETCASHALDRTFPARRTSRREHALEAA
jgi:hypothetical protein